jgi:hypothetical protein
MLKFRNINATPQDPVSEWGVEGTLCAIQRGSLLDWQKLVHAAKNDPSGEISRQIQSAKACLAPGEPGYSIAQIL